MGKAARRKASTPRPDAGARRERIEPAPFARRPFEGLAGETDWVAMREIVPAATASITLGASALKQAPTGVTTLTLATVLPMAWSGLHRADGTMLLGAAANGASGDPSRDLGAALLATLAAEPGVPVLSVPTSTAATPRLQDLIDVSAPLDVEVHEGFEFWIGDQELDDQARQSLDGANASIVPTVKLSALPSAYWCRIGARTHIRLVLPDDEDAATDALARLHAADAAGLGGPTKLLGAFRAGGLLVPVWDLDPSEEPAAYEQPLTTWADRYAAALASDQPLTAEERRSRSGLLSRQVTLR